jgi:hypothetical protein
MSKENSKTSKKKATYITRGEYKGWFESAAAAATEKGVKIKIIEEANTQLNRTLTGEINKVVKARIAHTKLMNDYDGMVLTSHNRRDKIIKLQEELDTKATKLKKFTDLSGFRKIVVILSDSVVNFIG